LQRACVSSVCVAVLFVTAPIRANDPNAKPAASGKTADGLVSLDPKGIVRLDRDGKRLLIKTRVVLREGMLEMLCCPAQTKEHESILAVDAKAYIIHAGLLALGAKPGGPVQYRPEFKPPTGQQIDIFLQWTDATGKPHRVRAHRRLGHRTLLITGALDVAIEPLRPLFDEASSYVGVAVGELLLHLRQAQSIGN